MKVLPPGPQAVVTTVGAFAGSIAGASSMPALHPLILSVAEAGVRVRFLQTALEAAALRGDELEALPELDLSSLPDLPEPPTAPTLDPPSLPGVPALPAGYAAAVARIAAAVLNEDSEITQAAATEAKTLLEEWQTELNDAVQRFQAEVSAYRVGAEVYSSEVQAYAALLQATSVALNSLVTPYLALHVQARLARFQALVESRGALVQRLSAALQAAQSEHARRMALISVAPPSEAQRA